MILMPNVSIIKSDKPMGPADEGILRYEKQQKRTDPESLILREYKKKYAEVRKSESSKIIEEVIMEYCDKLGGLTFEQFIHKLEIFYGNVEDDEREWREKKYGKQ